MSKLRPFFIGNEAPRRGKFMDSCFEMGAPPWCACNGCGQQGHAELPWSVSQVDVQQALEDAGWQIFWMIRSDTRHYWQMATCPACSTRLADKLAQYRSSGCQSANLNDDG